VSSAKPATPDPTEIAERYVIEKKLGAGAFGTVYKARDKKLRRLVAIKTIRLEASPPRASRSRTC
jgi:serine/threonine protein kinase